MPAVFLISAGVAQILDMRLVEIAISTNHIAKIWVKVMKSAGQISDIKYLCTDTP